MCLLKWADTLCGIQYMNSTNELVKIEEEQLFYGKPIRIDDVCLVYPFQIREVCEIGSLKFKEYLTLLTANPREIYPDMTEDLDTLTFIIKMASVNSKFLELTKEAFRLFLHDEITIFDDLGTIHLGRELTDNRFLTTENFPRIQYVLRRMYWLSTVEHKNPSDEIAAAIIEKINRGNEIVAQVKAKKGEDDGVDFNTLIASLSLYFRSVEEVMNLSYYAFFDLIKRMQFQEEYETNLRASFAGAKIPKDKMKYWIRKISKNDIGGH